MSGWLVDFLVLLGVLAIVIVAAWFVFTQFADQLPDPIRKILLIVLVIIAAIVAIMVLLHARGGIKLGERPQSPQIGAVIPAVPDIATTGSR